MLSLLLRVAQTRSGAALVLNAGLFHSVRDSQIFSADPDIGFGKFLSKVPPQLMLISNTEVDNPTALQRFFNLMLAVLRVINAVVLSRGQQNDHTLQMAREFLKENRLSIIGVFKRNARVGGRNVHDVADLNDLVDQFTLLLSATNFLEVSLSHSRLGSWLRVMLINYSRMRRSQASKRRMEWQPYSHSWKSHDGLKIGVRLLKHLHVHSKRTYGVCEIATVITFGR